MITKTLDQILAEGHTVLSNGEEQLKTRVNQLIVIWKRISQFKFQRVEQFREGIVL